MENDETIDTVIREEGFQDLTDERLEQLLHDTLLVGRMS